MKSKNMNYLIAFVMSIVVAVSIAACGTPAATPAPSTDATAAPSTDATAAPSTDATATTAPASGDIVAKFDFSNTGTLDICQLFLSPTTTNDWGPDQLAGQKIPAGQKFTLTNIPAGTYDAKAVACDGTTEATIQVNIKNP